MTTFSSEHQAARDAVQQALRTYLDIHNRELAAAEEGDEKLLTARREGNAIITAWVAAIEWTNVGLEQENAACRDVLSDLAQPLSASAGLGQFIVNFYG